MRHAPSRRGERGGGGGGDGGVQQKTVNMLLWTLDHGACTVKEEGRGEGEGGRGEGGTYSKRQQTSV